MARPLRIALAGVWYHVTARGNEGRPIYREQRSLRAHRQIRDRVASIEAALARQLKDEGYNVVGNHPSSRGTDGVLYRKVLQKVRTALKSRAR